MMKEDIIKTVVFFVLIIVIALSILGNWRVITMDLSKNSVENNNVFPESESGAGYVSISINQEEENND